MKIHELGIELSYFNDKPQKGWTTIRLRKTGDGTREDQIYAHGFISGIFVGKNVHVGTPNWETVEVNMHYTQVIAALNEAISGLEKDKETYEADVDRT